MEDGRKLDYAGRPLELPMGIHTGVLESLGINMYTSIGKSLVEFVANSHDSDATYVRITLPFADIEKARAAVRAQAKKDVAEKKRDPFSALYDALPDTIKITVEDDGHGMTAQEVVNKFLVINRNRRTEDGTMRSESSTRIVMGRKGLGKLAGFGAAQNITVRTKRKTQTYATVFTMNFDYIKKVEKMGEVKFIPEYEEGLDPEDQGTKIILSGLRCDSLKSKAQTIMGTLAMNFAHFGEDFRITLNVDPVEEEPVDYEFLFPTNLSCDSDGLATQSVDVDDVFEYPIRYRVKFRALSGDKKDTSPDGKKKGSLPARMRGARIYCNKRLAAGPSLLYLGTGMHNFHSQSYMECIVHADTLDLQEIDYIGTNRSELKADSEVVEALFTTVTELMRKALAEHSKFRDTVADDEVKKDPFSSNLLKTIEQLPKKSQTSAKKILAVLAKYQGTQSDTYKEIAPLMLHAVNAGEVLVNLIKSGADPESLAAVTHELVELVKVERSDVLKHYRGRRNGIEALQKLEARAHEIPRGPLYEKELHNLLKRCPWLIKPEYTNHLTSDREMGVVALKLQKILKIDGEVDPATLKEEDDKRPDLVFVMVNADSPDVATIVELKSPNIPLKMAHLTQLKGYMLQVTEVLKTDYRRMDVKVHGHLIGKMPLPDGTMEGKLLLDEIQKAGQTTVWEVISIPELLDRAKRVHLSTIEVLEKEEEEPEPQSLLPT